MEKREGQHERPNTEQPNDHSRPYEKIMATLAKIYLELRTVDREELDRRKAFLARLIDAINHAEAKALAEEPWKLHDYLLRREFDFDHVSSQIPKNLSLREQLQFFINQKAKFDHELTRIQETTAPREDEFSPVLDFGRRCEVEIEKLQRLTSVQAGPMTSGRHDAESEDKPGEREKRQKAAGLTNDNATLLMFYLFRALKVPAAKKRQAEVISALTGYSQNTIRGRLSNPFVNSSDDSVRRENLEFVRQQFEKLGLNQLVDQLNRDLEE